MAAISSLTAPDQNDPTIRQMVQVSGWVVIFVGVFVALFLVLDQQVQWGRVVLNLCAAGIGATTLIAARLQRQALASGLLVWGVWVIVSLVAAGNGGINSPNLLIYPVLIVLAGWLLGSRPTWGLLAMTAVLFGFFLWADVHGALPGVHPHNRWAYAVYMAGVAGLTAAATLLSRKSYLGRVLEAQAMAAEVELRDAELRKLLRVVEQSPESTVITDLNGRIEFVNDAFVERTGYARDEVLGQQTFDFSANGLAPAQQQGMRETLARGDSWAGEQTNVRKDGALICESVVVAPIRQPDGRITHYVELKQDLSDRKRAAEEIHRLAHFDPLTSLPNRSMLIERMANLQARHQRSGDALHALLLLDVDRFTNFNDARGSEMGDRLLCAVALRLSELLGAHDLLVRVAGDEFGMVLHDLSADAAAAGRRALAFADQIQQAFVHALPLGDTGEEAQLAVSMGLTLYPQGPEDTPLAAMGRAGTALHRAKHAGGARSAFFEQGMGAVAAHRFQMERDLRHAIGAQELRLYVQPQMNVQGQVMGVEALVRWQHPRDGLVPPGAFVPLAEESDLIVSLGDWVLAQACAVVASPEFSQRRLRMSVNLSARQFREAGFVPSLQALLRNTGADPTLLTLEVTEGLVIEDFDDVVFKMRELAALGVEFALDDFGTGYSSLAYLKRLPIQELKIDRFFVNEAPSNDDDGALVEAILSVASHFGLRVVAEGVETQQQVDFLAQREPNMVYQGYLFGRPEPVAQWLERLRTDALKGPAWARLQ
jgi:diguanylate cyclase (GGDEF)-like protein/PAS domain S-box-containing protein